MGRKEIKRLQAPKSRQKKKPHRLHALVRRTYFLNPEGSVHLSFGFFPALNYSAAAELGNARGKRVLLSPYFFSSIMMHLPRLCENMCSRLPYRCWEENVQLKTRRNFQGCLLHCDKNDITLNLEEINFLMANSTQLLSILSKYSMIQQEVKAIADSVNNLYEPGHNMYNLTMYELVKDDLQINSLN